MELTPDEIRQYKWEKYLMLEKKQKDEDFKKFKQGIMTPWTMKEMKEVILQKISYFGFSQNEGDGLPEFIRNDDNKKVLNALTMYFTDNPAFESLNEGWKLSKGIMLMGNVGVGKTTLMRLFANNKKRCFSTVNCDDISKLYQKEGAEAIEPYYDTPITNGDYRFFYQKYIGFCFDDFGSEGSKKNFGNELNVMADIILKRYDHKYEFSFDCTHLTTNLDGDQIEAFYGTRVRSRCREMFNVIELTGKDFR